MSVIVIGMVNSIKNKLAFFLIELIVLIELINLISISTIRRIS